MVTALTPYRVFPACSKERSSGDGMTTIPGTIDQITVRTANADDLPTLIPLINKAFAIEKFLDGTRTDEERLSATMREGTVLMAEHGEQVVACVYVELRGERAYFGMLAVDPTQQGKGLGKLMTEAAEQYGPLVDASMWTSAF
jgi:ribosomal protein S18 acetylase RimI-like enzyme